MDKQEIFSNIVTTYSHNDLVYALNYPAYYPLSIGVIFGAVKGIDFSGYVVRYGIEEFSTKNLVWVPGQLIAETVKGIDRICKKYDAYTTANQEYIAQTEALEVVKQYRRLRNTMEAKKYPEWVYEAGWEVELEAGTWYFWHNKTVIVANDETDAGCSILVTKDAEVCLEDNDGISTPIARGMHPQNARCYALLLQEALKKEVQFYT